jgi:hypothetical protein
MKTKTLTINENGLAQIRQFLKTHHKRGDIFDLVMLGAWASDAEFQLIEGNGATIEIRQWDSISGHTETFTVSPVGINAMDSVI